MEGSVEFIPRTLDLKSKKELIEIRISGGILTVFAH